MNKLKLEKKKLELDVMGNVHKLDFPTLSQYRKFTEELLNKPSKELDIYKDFLVELGMPEDLFDNLQVDHLMQIADTLTFGDTKKK